MSPQEEFFVDKDVFEVGRSMLEYIYQKDCIHNCRSESIWSEYKLIYWNNECVTTTSIRDYFLTHIWPIAAGIVEDMQPPDVAHYFRRAADALSFDADTRAEDLREGQHYAIVSDVRTALKSVGFDCVRQVTVPEKQTDFSLRMDQRFQSTPLSRHSQKRKHSMIRRASIICRANMRKRTRIMNK